VKFDLDLHIWPR